MWRALPLMLLCVVFAPGCRHRVDLTKPATQDRFGVQMARMNLWREAMFRFQRAVALNPADAMAHNNLAVAYEANGDFDAAAKEYREALRLDRSNQYIQKNYSRYTEFMSRNKKRQQKRDLTAAASAPAAPSTTTAVDATPASASVAPGAAAPAAAAPVTPPVPPPVPAAQPATSTVPPPSAPPPPPATTTTPPTANPPGGIA